MNMKTFLLLILTAALLSGCIVVPERPYHPAVVVY
jgi:starvation-inducible outer membrane lipoprotein